MARYLILSLLLFAHPATADLKLFVFDCGQASMDSMEIFGLTDEETDVRELFVPCYLVQHPKGMLLWDGGLPKAIADVDGPVDSEGSSMRYDRWIVDQLADMNVTPADIDYAAYSHLHFDHAGAANFFLESTVLMQRTEWDGAFGSEAAFIDTSVFDGLKMADVTFLDGDHDVFGDGSVTLIYAPGHTPGHQVLLLDLKNTGKLMLSGDLYHTRANRELRRVPTFNHDAQQTLASMERVEKLLETRGATLWIEHDMALARTLKRAPAYYD